MSELVLFWHRNDLRTIDSIGLARATQQHDRVVGVFCFDRGILDREDIAPVRVAYLLGCLSALAEDYARVGSKLLILNRPPVEGIPALAEGLGVKDIYWHLDVEPYSRSRDEAVTAILAERGVRVHNDWDRILHSPTEILTGANRPYSVYTPFWRNWYAKTKPAPAEVKLKPVKFTTAETKTIDRLISPLPTLGELGFEWQGELIFIPGTAAALDRLAEFVDRDIYSYDEQRNYPSAPGTSGLSAALKFGTIGIRQVWQATTAAMARVNSIEAEAGVRVWQQELAWREFYQQALYNFPELADGPYREQFREFPWVNNPTDFTAWCRGETGYPIVDAAMRQLNQTGWMHNRCRMIVASFLTKDLIIDWRWGEKYFMQTLIDGDLAANNGGWQWSASSGMDPKPLRIFNPATQAQKFDADGDYIRQWLPELAGLDTKVLLSGNIPPLISHRCNYPQPIVDHNAQQKLFKQLYARSKS
jgi:deoxyribodipyrimidine photo-lyase